MKTKIIIASVFAIILLGSCATRQHCDAYGKVETEATSDEEVS